MLHVFIRSADKYIHHCRGTESNRRKIKRVNPETHTHTHTQNRQSLYRNGDMQRASQLTLKWIQARKQGVEDWETKNRDGNPADKWNDPIASLQRENSEAELQGSASMMLRDGPVYRVQLYTYDDGKDFRVSTVSHFVRPKTRCFGFLLSSTTWTVQRDPKTFSSGFSWACCVCVYIYGSVSPWRRWHKNYH